ncbi:MAG: transporter substrate-binding domain-containing protein [Pseudomonadota bacterium]
MKLLLTLLALTMACALPASAQRVLIFSTVERPPFAFEGETGIEGFSADLMRAIGDEIGADIRFQPRDSFAEMLGDVQDGAVDGAIANISITGGREAVMDFTLPIFRSGLQIMVPRDAGQPSIWSAILDPALGLTVLGALAVLLILGMLMWVFERRKQPYFDRGAGEAMFPAFWYALNLVVHGGFSRDVPRSVLGRLFGVIMVLSSVFVLAFFVANITTALTVRALGDRIDTISDLDGLLVGTTADSTASAFLLQRDISHITFVDFNTMLWSFEDGDLDAVFFDSPLLAYYVATAGREHGRLIERVFRPEDYGIALPQGSDLRERINVALLNLQESGAYDALYDKWFEVSQP